MNQTGVKNTKLVLVSMSDNKLACLDYFEKLVDPEYRDFVEFYLDPELTIYKKLGFGFFIKPDGIWLLKEYAKLTLTESGSKLEDTGMIGPKMMENFSYSDFTFRKIVKGSNPFQMAGDAVLDESGEILATWPLKEVYDRPQVAEVLGLL